jgi:hypothetical protein
MSAPATIAARRERVGRRITTVISPVVSKMRLRER